MAVIEINKLVKSYSSPTGPSMILKKISFQVEQGEFLAVMGPSGSGKSTLMNILGCLDGFDSGSYKLLGKNVNNLTSDQLAILRCETIGFVFQGFNLMQRANLLDNVSLPMVYDQKPAEYRKKRAHELLAKVGLEKYGSYRPNSISGGQQQRVTIARALANKPSLILADEPTGNLDTKTGNEIMTLFRELNEEGNTIILITHEPDIALWAKRILRLVDGEIVYHGEVKDDPYLRKISEVV